MKQKKPAPRRVSRNGLLAMLAAALILSVAILGLFVLSDRHDAKRFAEASDAHKDVAADLAAHLQENVTSLKEQNICFNTEQGPYDDGRLWCQTTSIIKLKSDASYELIGRQFISSADQLQLDTHSSTNEGVARYHFDTGSGIPCTLLYIDSDGKYFGSSTRIPFSDTDGPAIALSCAARAQAAHYPYHQ